jgi:hypothetical protein
MCIVYFNSVRHVQTYLLSVLVSQVSQPKYLPISNLSHCATCPTYLILLHLVTLRKAREEYRYEVPLSYNVANYTLFLY